MSKKIRWKKVGLSSPSRRAKVLKLHVWGDVHWHHSTTVQLSNMIIRKATKYLVNKHCLLRRHFQWQAIVCVCMCVNWTDTCVQPSCSSIFWKGTQKQRVCLCWWDGAAGTSQLFCGCHLWQKGSWQKASKSYVNHSSGLFLINQEAFCSAQGSFALAMSLKSYKGIHDLKQMECRFHGGIPASPKFWTE